MKKAEDYKNRIFSLRKNVYIDGHLVSRDDPRLEPGLNTTCLTYNAPADADPTLKNLATTKSHLTGDMINRFTHIHHSIEDLIKKQLMTRLLCHRTGTCILRCMGIDAMNALYVATHEIDQKKATNYHQHFSKYLSYFQEHDIAACCAQTDVKGNRKLRPHEQVDPDLYLRLIEKRSDGIVVNGAKAHITMAAIAEEIIVVPTRVMTREEQNWAVAFAIPSDAEGVKLVTLGKYPPKRKNFLLHFQLMEVVTQWLYLIMFLYRMIEYSCAESGSLQGVWLCYLHFTTGIHIQAVNLLLQILLWEWQLYWQNIWILKRLRILEDY
jgi:aromatic ring hydroxylase